MNSPRSDAGSAPMRPHAAEMFARPHQLIALVFGIGLSRIWPGTLGAIAGFGMFLLLQNLSTEFRVIAYLMLLAVGTWAIRRTGEDLGDEDHNAIVFDETIAMSLVLEFVAPGALSWLAAFLLFRLFDVWKPWPIYLVDRSGIGGFPVILDDLLAALYAVLVIWCVVFVLG